MVCSERLTDRTQYGRFKKNWFDEDEEREQSLLSLLYQTTSIRLYYAWFY